MQMLAKLKDGRHAIVDTMNRDVANLGNHHVMAKIGNGRFQPLSKSKLAKEHQDQVQQAAVTYAAIKVKQEKEDRQKRKAENQQYEEFMAEITAMAKTIHVMNTQAC